jgi:hypothetical protein
MTLNEQIDLFFKKPHEPHAGGAASVLYLARQEAQNCLIGHVMQEGEAVRACATDPQRVFATSMVILAAIDLMAKLYDGKDAQKEVGRRIEAFAKEFLFTGLPSAETFAKVLYLGCRNPLLHSFTFENDTYTISVVTDFGRPGIVGRIRGGAAEHYAISVIGLYRGFVEACTRYEAAVRASANLQPKFAMMFQKYGTIETWQAVLEPVRTA